MEKPHHIAVTIVSTQEFWSVNSSDVRYVSIYRNIDIFVQYRDTILAFKCIDTLEWTV